MTNDDTHWIDDRADDRSDIRTDDELKGVLSRSIRWAMGGSSLTARIAPTPRRLRVAEKKTQSSALTASDHMIESFHMRSVPISIMPPSIRKPLERRLISDFDSATS